MEETEKILKKLWNYFGKSNQEHLMHWRRHPAVNAHLGIVPWLLFLTDHWGKFFFSLSIFSLFFFKTFPLELMYSNNYRSNKKKILFESLFHHPVWNYILMGDNPYIHDLLPCQEIFKTFFYTKYTTSLQNRRQQMFSLSLILLKTITQQQATGYN